MLLPTPEPGLVISYGYVWRHEHEGGQEEGRKRRPCVIVLAVTTEDGITRVSVAPITHRRPSDLAAAIEIPMRVKQHLGLDNSPSWVVFSEINQFNWPGHDLLPVSGNKGSFEYGFLPPRLFNQIKAGMLDLLLKRRVTVTSREPAS